MRALVKRIGSLHIAEVKQVAPLCLLGGLVLILQISIYSFVFQRAHGNYCDPDCYQRLNRVEELVRSGDWFNEKISKSDAPYGEVSHWGRPLDVILLAGATPLAPFLGMKQALFWSGVWVSPLLQAASAVLLLWVVAPLLQPFSRLNVLVFFLSQQALVSYYQVGRPDHHSLLLFALIPVCGLMVRVLLYPQRKRMPFLLGFMQAVLLWISVETLTVCLLIQFILGLAWLKGTAGFARVNRDYALALLAGAVGVMLLETPDHLFRCDVFDRLCLLHLLLFAAVALFWVGVWHLEQQGSALTRMWQRLALAFCGAVFCLAVIWRVAPDFVQGPFAHVDPRMLRLWLHNVQEVQPMGATLRAIVEQSTNWLWLLWIVLPWYVWLALKRRDTLSPDRPLLFFVCGSFLFAGLAVMQVRWSSYAELMLLLPAALCLEQLQALLEQGLRPRWFCLARIVLLMLFAVGYIPMLVLLNRPGGEGNATVDGPSKNAHQATVHELCDWLNRQSFFKAAPQRIAAQLDMGPELIYRTGQEAVASPYHRNAEGVLFVYDAMTSEDFEMSRRMLRGRGVTLLLLSPDSPEKSFYAQSGRKHSLYQKILDGKIPEWLEEIPLPTPLAKVFRLLKVRDVTSISALRRDG